MALVNKYKECISTEGQRASVSFPKDLLLNSCFIAEGNEDTSGKRYYGYNQRTRKTNNEKKVKLVFESKDKLKDFYTWLNSHCMADTFWIEITHFGRQRNYRAYILDEKIKRSLSKVGLPQIVLSLGIIQGEKEEDSTEIKYLSIGYTDNYSPTELKIVGIIDGTLVNNWRGDIYTTMVSPVVRPKVKQDGTNNTIYTGLSPFVKYRFKVEAVSISGETITRYIDIDKYGVSPEITELVVTERDGKHYLVVNGKNYDTVHLKIGNIDKEYQAGELIKPFDGITGAVGYVEIYYKDSFDANNNKTFDREEIRIVVTS